MVLYISFATTVVPKGLLQLKLAYLIDRIFQEIYMIGGQGNQKD